MLCDTCWSRLTKLSRLASWCFVLLISLYFCNLLQLCLCDVNEVNSLLRVAIIKENIRLMSCFAIQTLLSIDKILILCHCFTLFSLWSQSIQVDSTNCPIFSYDIPINKTNIVSTTVLAIVIGVVSTVKLQPVSVRSCAPRSWDWLYERTLPNLIREALFSAESINQSKSKYHEPKNEIEWSQRTAGWKFGWVENIRQKMDRLGRKSRLRFQVIIYSLSTRDPLGKVGGPSFYQAVLRNVDRWFPPIYANWT